MSEKPIVHLVAYGTPNPTSPDYDYARQKSIERDANRAKWPPWMVELTEADKMMCGLSRSEVRSVCAFEGAASAQPLSDVCPACIQAAAKAGRSLRVD
jgi:hypothetical protein